MSVYSKQKAFKRTLERVQGKRFTPTLSSEAQFTDINICPVTSCAEFFRGVGQLERRATRWCKKFDCVFGCFDTIHQNDKRTDGRTGRQDFDSRLYSAFTSFARDASRDVSRTVDLRA